jgi:hypothetical protein
MMWHGKQKNFNPEGEMKLLIADETVSDDPEQYRMLKSYSGQKYLTVNKKYQPEYDVLNNMNIIILTNAKTPIFVERDEIPTDDANNQFFVYEFKKFEGKIDKEYSQKIVDRLGHYIRTELKEVFDHLPQDGYRYSVATPITEAERSLFRNNVTDVESATDYYVQKLSDHMDNHTDGELADFLNDGYLPTNFLDQYSMPKGVKRNKLIQNFADRGYIQSCESERRAIKNNRRFTYKVTSKLKEAIGL